jgi:hypothetical protein
MNEIREEMRTSTCEHHGAERSTLRSTRALLRHSRTLADEVPGSLRATDSHILEFLEGGI